jgi:hypothetical protein
LSKGRNERVATGVWSAGDDLETLEEVPTFSLQKLEAMAVDALAVQAEVADDDAPFEVGDAVGTRTCSTRWCPRTSVPSRAARKGASHWALSGGQSGHPGARPVAAVRGGGRANGRASCSRRGCWAQPVTAPGGSRCGACT